MPTRLHSPDAAARWLRERTRGALVSDSRRVQPGDAFIAWPGATADGRRFVDAALQAGAAACLVEAEDVERFGFEDARIGALSGLKAATGPIADAFFGAPSQTLRVVAVTGTNGKTSSAWWIAQALTLAGRRCGVVGTLGIGTPPVGAQPAALEATGLTTPDPVVLQQGFRRMQADGLAACAIEASSIGLVEHRLAGTRIEVAVFTNFTRDHLDYHGSMPRYWQAKRGLFAWPGLRAAVVNLDDVQGAALAEELHAPLDVWTTSLVRTDARLRASELRYEGGGLAFTLHEGGQRADVTSRLIGDYNAANLLGVIGALRAMGIALDQACACVPQLTPVPGRMQRVGGVGERPEAIVGGRGWPEVVVDYAHTPDALDKALAALRPLATVRGGRLVCVFGCGGDRDASKRPLMGAVAERLADAVVVTSDNPRRERPAAIVEQIVAGFAERARARVIEDRRAAIATALREARPNDVVLIAGKGHEDYQEIDGVKHPFDDVTEARAALASLPLPQAGEEAARMATLGELASLLPTARRIGDAATPLARVHSDTRTLRTGDFFVALRGERFDAHDFLPQARAAGASAALAEQGLEAAGLAGLEVADSRKALGELAAAWRMRCVLPLIAVTGSNGKTTVTQMIACMLRAWLGQDGSRALATEGNFNNDIGVPLTLLRLRPSHRAAVVELGMNHPGEIAQLARIAAPTVALVNNAQREHQEFMASVEAVARENGAAIEALGAHGIAVVPAGDAHTALWRELAGARGVWTFALDDHAATVNASATWQGDAWHLELRTPAGAASARLRIAGRHNASNALAALACALAAGCPLDAAVRGLVAFEPVKGRSQAKPLHWRGESVALIDDSYNANPDSMRAAIDVLAALPAPRWLVIGDMGEVGDQGPAFHAEIGAHARAAGIEALWAAGAASLVAAQAYGANARHFATTAELVAALTDEHDDQLPPVRAVLVKGSRFMTMEKAVAALQARAAAGGRAC